MINFNGIISPESIKLSVSNRGFAYGDALFETIRVSHGKLFFWEDHYFRLMASMRILRMEIPMNFTMEYLEAQIQNTLKENNLTNSSARVKVSVFRNEGGLYKPEDHSVGFIIDAKPLDSDFYLFNDAFYEIDLFKDYYISPGLLTTLKTNNKALNVVGSVYAQENDLHNCLILNTNKQIVEALNGNVFIVKDKAIKTPPILDGCLNGIMRKQILRILEKVEAYQLEEVSISPFELQKADEIFITNVIVGIQSVSKYRKKTYDVSVAKDLLQKLNVTIRLSN